MQKVIQKFSEGSYANLGCFFPKLKLHKQLHQLKQLNSSMNEGNSHILPKWIGVFFPISF